MEKKKALWLHDNGKSSVLSGRKNVISLQSDLADVILESTVTCLFEFMRKAIILFLAISILQSEGKYLLYLLKEITSITLPKKSVQVE